MKRRSRLLAALFALSALVLFQAEGLWASSACPPEMEMPRASEPASADSPCEACPTGESGHSHERDENGSKAPDCPLMPAGAASCVGGIALLPSSSAPALVTVEDEHLVASSDHAKDLLLAVSLLRPPRP